MITKRTHLGDIIVTKQFFQELIGRNIISCYGVVDINAHGAKQALIDSVPELTVPDWFVPKARFGLFLPKKTQIDKGVLFKIIKDKLYIELHITVMYGVNVTSIVKSIQHKIKFAVEEEIEIPVERVDIFVDGIMS